MSTGIALSQEQHEEELKKYNQMVNNKTREYVDGGEVTAKQIIDKLKEVDEVVVIMEDTILRVKPNVIYINDASIGIQPTSTEPKVEYMVDYDTKKWVNVKPNWVFPEPRKALRTVPVYSNTPISNAYTGEQLFEQMLENILKREHMFGGENI